MQIFGFNIGSNKDASSQHSTPEERKIKAYPFQKLVTQSASIISQAKINSQEEYIYKKIPEKIFTTAGVAQIPSMQFDANNNLQRSTYPPMKLEDRRKLIRWILLEPTIQNFRNQLIVLLNGIAIPEEIDKVLNDHPSLKDILQDVLPSEP